MLRVARRHPLLLAATRVALLLLCGGMADGAPQRGPVADETVQVIEGHRFGASRRLSFTSDEITWLSPDLSGDGRTIIFDALGDLFSVSIEGGRATQLTSGVAIDYRPRLVPGTRDVRFVSDRSGERALWEFTLSVDGLRAEGLRRIAGEGLPNASNDWRRSFYETSPDVEGQQVRTRDGSFYRRTCNTRHDQNVIDLRDLRCTIVRVDPNGSEATIAEVQGDLQGLVLSHDESQLLYFNQVEALDTALRVLDIPTRRTRILLDQAHPILRMSPTMSIVRFQFERVPRAVFTPDDHFVIVARNGRLTKIETSTGLTRSIPMIVPFDMELSSLARAQARVQDGVVEETQIRGMTPSPDRTSFVVEGMGKIYIVDAQNGVSRRLTTSLAGSFRYETAPTWMPDGRSVVFVAHSEIGSSVWRAWIDQSHSPVRLDRDQPAPLGAFDNPSVTQAGDVIVDQRAAGNGFGLFNANRPGPSKFIPLPPLVRVSDVLDADGGGVAITTASTRTIAQFGERIVPVCGARFDRRGRRGALTFLFSLRSRRGAMAYGGNVPAPITQSSLRMRLSPDQSRILIGDFGAISLATLPSTSVRAIRELRSQGALRRLQLQDDERCNQPSMVDLTRPPASGPTSNWVDSVPIALGVDPGWHDANALIFADGPLVRRIRLAGMRSESANPAPEVTRIRIERSVAHPNGALVLSGVRVIPMAGPVELDSADIVVVGNRITQVTPHGAADVPPMAMVIDGTGLTVIPGLIDGHAHAAISAVVHDPRSTASLAYGVTTLFDPNADNSYASWLIAIGDLVGPRLLSTGRPLYPLRPRGLFPRWFSPEGGQAINSNIQSSAMALNFAGYEWLTNWLKWRASGDSGEERRDTQAFMRAAQRLGFSVPASHHSDLSLDRLFDGFGGVDHTWPPIPLYDDYAQLFAASGMTVRPTLMAENIAAPTIDWARNNSRLSATAQPGWDGAPNTWQNIGSTSTPPYGMSASAGRLLYQFAAQQIVKLARRGARVAVGSDSNLIGLGAHLEMYALVDAGLPALEALRAATINEAYALGIDRDLGSIEVGKLADLVVLDGNPLEDIRDTTNIRYVIANGVIYDPAAILRLGRRD